jgi:chaperone required for assembly of F1-ATPase
MKHAYALLPQDSAFAVTVDGKTLMTPGKQALLVPTQALAEAVMAEWSQHGKFSAARMPLTSMAYTALDQIGSQKSLIVESLMAYVDTDTLAYRSSGSDKLAQQQKKQWDPVLDWAGKRIGGKWNVTAGLMPIDQPEALHNAVRAYLNGLDSMRMAVMCFLSASFSSLVLAMAVMEKHMDAEAAFYLSRLEEESQAEAWGRDADADKRAERLKGEIISSARFLDLLNPA